MPNKAPEWLSDDIREFYNPSNVNIRAIQRAIQEKRGVDIAYMTITDRMKRLGLARPGKQSKTAKGKAMSEETPVEVLPGQLSIEDADTPAEVHYGAVNEFDALPDRLRQGDTAHATVYRCGRVGTEQKYGALRLHWDDCLRSVRTDP